MPTLMCLRSTFRAVSTIVVGVAVSTPNLSGQPGTRLGLSRPTALISASEERINIDANLRVAIGPSGQIAIAEGGGAFVGLIDASGRLQRVGREGGGPGELRGGLWVGWRRDTLVVTDANARRTTLFHRGRVARTIPFRGTASKTGLLETPLFLIDRGAVCPVVGVRSARDWGPGSTPLVLTSIDGSELIDTLFRLNEPLGRLVVQRAASTLMLLQPFSASTIVASNGSGTFFARIERDVRTAEGSLGGGSGTASLFAGDGRRLYSTTVPFRATRLDTKIVEYVIDTTLEAINRNRKGASRLSMDDYRRSLITPLNLPTVADVVVSNDGSVLLREWTAPSDSVSYAVLDPLGRSRGYIRVSTNQRVVAADERQVLSVREGPDGEWELTRSRWEKPSAKGVPRQR